MQPFQMPEPPRPKVLFLVTEDWYFCSHRLELAKAARAIGYDVHVACRVDRHGDCIREAGITLHALDWQRNERDPASFLRAIKSVSKIYAMVRPDICHHVALKPILIGGLAARLTGRPAVISAVAGLGAIFTMNDYRARLMRRLAAQALRLIADQPTWHMLFQNTDDKNLLISLGALRHAKAHLIRGAGVDTEHFKVNKAPVNKVPTFALVARMLTIKGVIDAVTASRRLDERGIAHRLLLCGAPDPGSRASIPRETIENWNNLPSVSWLGHITDVRDVWTQADVAIQPSLGGEGLPKSLLEAAACSKPIIATDVPGCREIARQGVNALIVPPGDPEALAKAMEILASSPSERHRMGLASRALVEADFSLEAVTKAMLAIYGDNLLDGKLR